ncbi:MAG: 5-formyltetrahydrofolate cyclo-ligase [Micrococcaceae bacterium]|nr:5-formyltetrahydrofolate cyclo-ligase [Micrococcaceae bacterium]
MTSDTKAELRAQFFTQRKELDITQRQLQSEVLCQTLFDWYRGLESAHRDARKVAMTIKFGSEPDTDPLMHALHNDGVELWAPISNKDRSMSWTRWYPGVPMEQSALAPIDEPVGERFGPEAVADADVILVPALAADTGGYRLGKGGGYYDRFLAALSELSDEQPLLVTPLFDHEYFAADDEAFPIEAHDLPVQAVVTASTGLVWVQ